MSFPLIHDDPMYQLIRNEKIEEFNRQKHSADISNLKDGNYRGLDLRKLDVDGLDLSGAYLRNADLRGLDLRNTNLRGASLNDAKVSGCYFPEQITAEEVRMSVEFGTRLRCRID